MTNTRADSLLRFKRNFAPAGESRYLTGEQVFDEEAYSRLCGGSGDGRTDGAGARDGTSPASSYFPAYRAPRGDDR